MTDLKIDIERTIQASAKQLYQAWLNPEMLSKFMFPASSVKHVEVENSAVIGGNFKIIMKTAEQDIPHDGEYLELKPYTKIVFTWNSPFSIEGSNVTLTFNESTTGTIVKLSHIKFPSEESFNNHNQGWLAILDTLEKIAS